MYARDVNDGKARMPVLISGPSGSGKTSSAHLLAMETGWNVVELNSSDYRDKESIERRLLSAATSRSIFGARNMILLDEVDEMASYLDKGSSAAISNLISAAKNPVVLIANDRWSQKISFLRSKVDPVEFRKLRTEETVGLLASVAKLQAIEISRENIDMIAARSNGDARSAINDLSVAAGFGSDITEVIGMRDRKVDVFNLLDKIFFANTLAAPLRAIGNTDLSNDMMIGWLEENIPNRYTDSEDLSSALSALAEASGYATKAMRAQYYTYWRYMKVLMSSGIALSKSRYPSSAKRYSFPKMIKELSLSKGSRAQNARIAEKMQGTVHSSVKRIVRNEMRVLAVMVKRSLADGIGKGDVSDYLVSKYGLDEKEAAAFIEAA